MTIVGQLRQNAENYPEKAAIYYEQSRISYKDCYEIANALARLLLDVGVNKGDRVGLLLHRRQALLGIQTRRPNARQDPRLDVTG